MFVVGLKPSDRSWGGAYSKGILSSALLNSFSCSFDRAVQVRVVH